MYRPFGNLNCCVTEFLGYSSHVIFVFCSFFDVTSEAPPLWQHGFKIFTNHESMYIGNNVNQDGIVMLWPHDWKCEPHKMTNRRVTYLFDPFSPIHQHPGIYYPGSTIKLSSWRLFKSVSSTGWNIIHESGKGSVKIYLEEAWSFPPWSCDPNFPLGRSRLVLLLPMKSCAMFTVIMVELASPWW